MDEQIPQMSDEAFGARLGAALRAAEPLPSGAEARLLATLAGFFFYSLTE